MQFHTTRVKETIILDRQASYQVVQATLLVNSYINTHVSNRDILWSPVGFKFNIFSWVEKTKKQKPKPCLIFVNFSVLPCGSPPPFGERFVQKIVWLTWPPPLNLRAAWRATCVVTSPKNVIQIYTTYSFCQTLTHLCFGEKALRKKTVTYISES